MMLISNQLGMLPKQIKLVCYSF